MEREHEISIDAPLAKALVGAQFKEWSDLPISAVHAASTDNVMFRLGDELAIRFPRRASAEPAIVKETTWLPRLARGLPMEVPLPVAAGQPADGYPYCWSVVQWLEGAPMEVAELRPSLQTARDLAAFITALRAQDTSAAPLAGPHNHLRGAPLAAFDPEMRRRFNVMSDVPDLGAIVAAWERGLAVPTWVGPPVWVHGDLKAANLLMRDHTLTGVLDWGLAGVGDPAADLSGGWSIFDGRTRTAFRAALAVDDTAWARGRAWALIEGVLNLSYYRGRVEVLAQAGRRVIDQVLADRD